MILRESSRFFYVCDCFGESGYCARQSDGWIERVRESRCAILLVGLGIRRVFLWAGSGIRRLGFVGRGTFDHRVGRGWCGKSKGRNFFLKGIYRSRRVGEWDEMEVN